MKMSLHFVLHIIIISSICISGCQSKRLTIYVPNGYTGAICLVKSNLKGNILKIDSNGIGYLNEETFEQTILKPVVIELDGTNITERIVGFNPEAFWAIGEFKEASSNDSILSRKIQFLSFEVVPKGKEGQTQYYTIDLMKSVDTAKVLW